MPMLEIDGRTVHYQQEGSGPDVVLIHAFTSNLSIWALTGIFDELSDHYRVTSYDLVGHGLSSVVPSGYESAAMASDLQRLHSALQLQPAHLVGHSFGGVVAVHAALDFPDVVSSVVLSDTYFPALRGLEPNMGQTDVWTDLRDQLRKLDADIGDRVDFSRLFREVAAWSPDQHLAAQEELGAVGARWISQISQLSTTRAGEEIFDLSGLTADRIAKLRQPLTALYDEFSPFEATCDYLKRHVANCHVDVVPGAKHLAPAQNPTAFVALVRKHLQQFAA